MVNSIINKFGKWLGVDSNFASWFVTIGIIIQLITCYIMHEPIIAVCSGISGVISVVLCSQKKYSFYFWGLLQTITIIIISFQSELYGKVLENSFYLITMFMGMFIWKKNLNGNETQVRTMDWIDYTIFITIIIPIVGFISYMIVNKY